MATLKTVLFGAAVGTLGGLGGCGDLQGFSGEAPPLASIHVVADGDLAPLRPEGDTGEPALRVGLVWSMQWLPEPLCILPPENADVAAVLAVGCRDPFGVVPVRVSDNIPIELGVPATMDLDALPDTDVLVGDLTSRVAYASLVLYDDRDGDGTLGLGRANRLQGRDDHGPDAEESGINLTDAVYGSSFLSMTRPDQRVAYSEGTFNPQSAFFPRQRCGPPPAGFSILKAGGFTREAAFAATLAGRLPDEDPATCSEATDDAGQVTIAVESPGVVGIAACTEGRSDGSVRYREPPIDMPDLTNRTIACAHLPTLDGTVSPTVQLLISGRSDDSCPGLSHYVLAGCRDDPACALPRWDHTATPPTWWPCPGAE